MALKDYIIPIIGLGLTAYGAFKSTAAQATAQGGVVVKALPADASKVTTIKGITIYNSSTGYYAQQGTSPLVMPLNGSNIFSFVNQLHAAGMI